MHEELQTPAFLKGSTQIHFILIKPLSCADTCCTFEIIFSSAENTKLFLFYFIFFFKQEQYVISQITPWQIIKLLLGFLADK